MYEYKRSVEEGRLLPNLIVYLLWVCLLILPLSLPLCQQPIVPLELELQKVEVEQDV